MQCMFFYNVFASSKQNNNFNISKISGRKTQLTIILT